MLDQILKITFTVPSVIRNFCTPKTFYRRIAVGLLILLSSCLATISMIAFLQFASLGKGISVVLGLFWGFFIFTFDRSLFTNTASFLGTTSTVLRIIFIVILSFLVSVPLELSILKDRIVKEQNDYFQQEYQDVDSTKRLDLAKLINKENQILKNIAIQDSLVVVYSKLYSDEVAGIKTINSSGDDGTGPISDGHLASKNRAIQRVTVLNKELIQIRRENRLLRKEIIAASDAVKSKPTKDPLSMLESLDRLKHSKNDNTRRATRKLHFLLQVLFIFLEVSPALAKLTMGTDEYDYWNNAEEDINRKDILIQANTKLNQIKAGNFRKPIF